MVDIYDTFLLSQESDWESTNLFQNKDLIELQEAINRVPPSVFEEDPEGFDEGIAEQLRGYHADSLNDSEVKLWDNRKHALDLYHAEKRIAVEIEKAEQKYIFKTSSNSQQGPNKCVSPTK